MNGGDDHTLEFLLAFDGRIHRLDQGYWLKFEIKRVEPEHERPHGLSYSLTLLDPDGQRLIGFDNAHTVAALGSRFNERPVEADHWHRTQEDEGRFTDADTLLGDFFTEVRRILAERGVGEAVTQVEERRVR
jgi:hypothetical protein